MDDAIQRGFDFGFAEGVLVLVLVAAGVFLFWLAKSFVWLAKSFKTIYEAHEEQRTEAVETTANAVCGIRDFCDKQTEVNGKIVEIAETHDKVRRAAYSSLDAAIENLPADAPAKVRDSLKQAQRDLA